jgi:hypothetical protein
MLPKGVRGCNVLATAAQALFDGLSKKAIVSGFAACGIWPLDPERLLRSVGISIDALVEEVEHESKLVMAGASGKKRFV